MLWEVLSGGAFVVGVLLFVYLFFYLINKDRTKGN